MRMGLGGLLSRFAASLGLVLATYNPTGYSFVGWVAENFPRILPLQAVVGVVLSGVWLFFGHATWRSLGTLGVGLGVAFFAAVLWLFSSWGWFNPASHAAQAWAVLLFVSCLLTLGLAWALIRVRVSGQAVIEEVDR